MSLRKNTIARPKTRHLATNVTTILLYNKRVYAIPLLPYTIFTAVEMVIVSSALKEGRDKNDESLVNNYISYETTCLC